MNGSSPPSTFSQGSPWRSTALFSAAGLVASLIAVLLPTLPIPYLVGFTFVYGYGILFAASVTVAGTIAYRLKWIGSPASWFRICLAAAITAVSYPVALIGGASFAGSVETWLNHTRHFAGLVRVVIGSNGILVYGALMASVLIWTALSVVQRQWSMKTLVRLAALGVSWVAGFTVISTAFQSRLENLLRPIMVPSLFWIGLLLSIGAMLFGGVCGHALATDSTAHGTSANQDVPGDVHQGVDERAGH